MTNNNVGVCAIKEEFVVTKGNEANNSENNLKRKHESEIHSEDESKIIKCNEQSRQKNKKRGQNKSRPRTFYDDKQSKPCPTIINVRDASEKVPCQFNNCKYVHDPIKFIQSKPEDIGSKCYIYDIRGRCPRGIACRFSSSHITAEGFNLVDEEKFSNWEENVKNVLPTSLQLNLQKKTYDFSLSEKLVQVVDKRKSNKNSEAEKEVSEVQSNSGVVTDEDLIRLLPREKKKIDWRDKLYLAPLTTVGNLPFRRICKEFGADVTCGEMALCESLLKGFKQEWALIKRHECEDIFGTQICGNNVYTLSKVAQVLQENAELDFVDLNVGCPIDLIYKKGGGSGMMHRLPCLEASVRCASRLLSVPFTVKIRTGIYQDKKIAHNIVPKLAEWGASLITIHGRSREARYTKSADWEYIEECAKAAAPCPVFGNGDILSYEDYKLKKLIAPSVQGVMIGRGALIKPWIFTEIKEVKLWDISSKERFEILKKYTNYGLEHWGSDTQGVENTRKFLLEWLSFLYRYVPVALLETPPQRINERPPVYFGRDDLETLMASANCSDWIKITEMLLGPVPDGFQFLPKHKANSY